MNKNNIKHGRSTFNFLIATFRQRSDYRPSQIRSGEYNLDKKNNIKMKKKQTNKH